jgi:hypothetical protein
MSIASKGLDQITAEDIAGLVGAAPDPQHIATLEKWSRADAAAAAASLANAAGGLVIVQATVTEADLLSAVSDLGPTGRYLAHARVIEAGGKKVGVIAVSASAAPPVLVETNGAVYGRSEAGQVQVLTRSGLDELLQKEQLSRERAEHNIEGMIDRVAFGHFNYMTVSVIVSPRTNTDQPYRWAADNQAAILGLDLARSCGLNAGDVAVSAGEIEIALSANDSTGFIRVARNGCVAVGERLHRPTQDRYLAPAALGKRLSEMVAAATAPFQSIHVGAVTGALFLEGVRDLTLPVAGGATAPVGKDLIREFVSLRYLDAAEERDALRLDVLKAAGGVFAADLVAGKGQAKAAPARPASLAPQAWHGLTRRTERRVAGLRGHGSAR